MECQLDRLVDGERSSFVIELVELTVADCTTGVRGPFVVLRVGVGEFGGRSPPGGGPTQPYRRRSPRPWPSRGVESGAGQAVAFADLQTDDIPTPELWLLTEW